MQSLKDTAWQSDDMRRLMELSTQSPVERSSTEVPYDTAAIFPGWIRDSADFQYTKAIAEFKTVDTIFAKDADQRSPDEEKICVRWLKSVWPLTVTLGNSKTTGISRRFSLLSMSAGRTVVEAGASAPAFFIVLTGTLQSTNAHTGRTKNLKMGSTFGEAALTGNSAKQRTYQETVVVTEKGATLLMLQRTDFDYFVRDVQFRERQENLEVIRNCELFSDWSRTRLDRLAALCTRKGYKAGEYIFHQGEEADGMYFVVEGELEVIKEVSVRATNRWPTGMNEWAETSRTYVRPFTVLELKEGNYFGELAIIQHTGRTASVRTKTACVLLVLDKSELVGLINRRQGMEAIHAVASSYPSDGEVLTMFNKLLADDHTTAYVSKAMEQRMLSDDSLAPTTKTAETVTSVPVTLSGGTMPDFQQNSVDAPMQHTALVPPAIRRGLGGIQAQRRNFQRRQMQREVAEAAARQNPNPHYLAEAGRPNHQSYDLALPGIAAVPLGFSASMRAVDAEHKEGRQGTDSIAGAVSPLDASYDGGRGMSPVSFGEDPTTRHHHHPHHGHHHHHRHHKHGRGSKAHRLFRMAHGNQLSQGGSAQLAHHKHVAQDPTLPLHLLARAGRIVSRSSVDISAHEEVTSVLGQGTKSTAKRTDDDSLASRPDTADDSDGDGDRGAPVDWNGDNPIEHLRRASGIANWETVADLKYGATPVKGTEISAAMREAAASVKDDGSSATALSTSTPMQPETESIVSAASTAASSNVPASSVAHSVRVRSRRRMSVALSGAAHNQRRSISIHK